MAVLLFLLAVVVSSTFADPMNIIQEKYLRYFEHSKSNGALRQTEALSNIIPFASRQASSTQYNLYTRRNPTSPQLLVMDDTKSITSSNFKPALRTIVVVHGWLDDLSADSNSEVRDAYLKKSDVNVIIVDWGSIAIGLYTTAVNGVPSVGRSLGQFLRFINKETGAPFTNMHLIGFSLGAHVVGNAGRELDGQIARITGLDPAGPLWFGNSNCLRASDAEYVEGIHSDGSLVGLGIGAAVGDVDFFANGGNSQPGCSDSFCNHERAWRLFAATVTFDHLVGHHCNNILQLHLNSCRGSSLHMGNDDVTKRGSGIYRVNTDRVYPY